MKKALYLVTFIAIVVFINGCGASKKKVAPIFYEEDEIEQTQKIETSNGISIHGMSGAYPVNYKDKTLGKGLFNHKFFDISNIIVRDVSETRDKKIKIKIKTRSRSRDVRTLVKEGKKFFKQLSQFKVVENSTAPDVIVDIKEIQTVKFTISFLSYFFESQGTDRVIDIGMSISEVAKESVAFWSKVIVKDKYNANVIYKVMKNPVTVSQYNPKFVGDKPVTNIKYMNADDYCFKTYGGFVTPIYIYEYALREGAIKPPSNGVNREMISGFDEANEDDMALKKDGDIVMADESSRNDDFSNIVIFNYKAKRYTFKRDSFISQSVTFRCAK